MNYFYGMSLVVVSAAVVASAMAQTFSYVFKSVGEIHDFRRKEEWKKEVFKAWRR